MAPLCVCSLCGWWLITLPSAPCSITRVSRPPLNVGLQACRLHVLLHVSPCERGHGCLPALQHTQAAPKVYRGKKRLPKPVPALIPALWKSKYRANETS